MSNCLFEAAYERIIHDCNCMPSFHQLAHKDVSEICTGPGLTCMNKILRFIGKLNRVSVHDIAVFLSASEDFLAYFFAGRNRPKGMLVRMHRPN